jgi:hypothetical protein
MSDQDHEFSVREPRSSELRSTLALFLFGILAGLFATAAVVLILSYLE